MKNLVFLSSLFLVLFSCNRSAPLQRPNIIYIYTDQQSASMMSCAGNEWLKTPAMDYIAEHGVRFTRAYTTNPVCSPARVREGENQLKITLVSSLRNLLGPHHHRDGELLHVGPASFTGKTTWTGCGPGDMDWYDVRLTREPRIWRDDYHCIPFGFLSEPEIVSRNAEGQF